MAASDIQNLPAPIESKSAKKKKAKGQAERTESPAPSAPTPEKAGSVAAGDAQDDGDNAHIRDLQKSIRNITKKITSTAKIDAIIAEHPGKSLDDLVATKVINADQKAAHLRKPGLQAQLFQLEEQLAQHKKVAREYLARLAEQEKALTEKFEKEKADAVAELTEKADADAQTALHDNFLILSQFLRLAAARRVEDADSTSDESQALEGVLLHIYSGDENAVATMLKLVQGADEQTRSTTGETLQTTFAQVKQAAIAHAASFTQTDPTSQPAEPTESPPIESDAVESKQEPETDPTVANASLTEVDDGSATVLTNGHVQEALVSSSSTAHSNTDVADDAANAAGESQWDTGNETSPTSTQEWVDVKIPREPSETETGLTATPAAPSNTQSWADDHPEAEAIPSGPADDGFQSVPGRHRGNREGGWRGRGGYRGRGGFRGEGRGRGRGRGGPRGNGGMGPRRGGDEQH
ncbi:hypothetical protein N657DRAFT_575510 [Parathielavia appendiculata]|uniref:YAG7-like dimerisation domain-containing protein n=1 Tax=Parathielavia appendiculata TaxID=2587402 RepID=A0AAN6Z3J5_9PEZI|nr:hypothetical protein N657DRAFT_575510 [Parathielavia appendiculata]